MAQFQRIAARVGLISIACLGAAFTARCPAAEQTRSELAIKFQNGDIPTGDDFAAALDGYIHKLDDGFTMARVAVAPDGGAGFYEQGVLVDGSLPFGEAVGLSGDWAGQTGFMPVSFSIGPETHFGFIEVTSGQPGSSALYPMVFHALVYEDVAGASLVAATTPEPPSLVLAALGAIGLVALVRRRKR